MCVRLRGVDKSAVEHRPADVVSQPLIVKDEFANGIRELFALPPTLKAGPLLAPRGSRTRRLDRVGGRTELVGGDVRHHCRLAGCICGMSSGSAQLSCRSHGMATRRTGLRHPDLAARPCPDLLDRLAGPRIRGLHRLEEVQNMFCARGRPQSQEPMVGVRERPPRRMVMNRGSRSLGRITDAPYVSARSRRLRQATIASTDAAHGFASPDDIGDRRPRRAHPSVSQNARGVEGGEPSLNAGSVASRYEEPSCGRQVMSSSTWWR